MSKTERLTKPYEYKEVYKKGQSFANRELVMYVLRRDDTRKRMGISINKKVGHAVKRNRLKRVIREVFRLKKENVKEGLDLVFIVRRGIEDTTYRKMEQTMEDLFKKARIIKDNGGY